VTEAASRSLGQPAKLQGSPSGAGLLRRPANPVRDAEPREVDEGAGDEIAAASDGAGAGRLRRGWGGGGPGRARSAASARGGEREREGEGERDLTHPLLGPAPTLDLLSQESRERQGRGRGRGVGRDGGLWVPRWLRRALGWEERPPRGGGRPGPLLPRKMPMRIEPKTFFANERTFLSWMHMSVVTGTVASALLGLARGGGAADGGGGDAGGASDGSRRAASGRLAATLSALVLLPTAILVALYAIYTYHWRLVMLRRREVGAMDDPAGPVVLAGVLSIALFAVFVVGAVDLWVELAGDWA